LLGFEKLTLKIQNGTTRLKERPVGMKRWAVLTLLGSPTAGTTLTSIDPFQLPKTRSAEKVVGFCNFFTAMKTISRVKKTNQVI